MRSRLIVVNQESCYAISVMWASTIFKAFFVLLCAVTLAACSDGSDFHLDIGYSATAQAEATAYDLNIEQNQVWNDLDPDGEAAVNNYPFLRIRDGTLALFETYESYRDVVKYFSMPEIFTTEWDHTVWDELEVVQSSPTKVHLAGLYSRINKDGDTYLTTQTLRIVTLQSGQWGIKVRSTYPLATPIEISNIAEKEIVSAESAARNILEKYIEARNNRGMEDLAELHHYPSVVLPSVDLQLFNAPEDYITYEENTVMHNLDYAEWDHSKLNLVEVI